jgi:ubiquinone/menaquinone biosynthesis C-methylase UbiE
VLPRGWGLNNFERALGHIAGGKILDIATREGHFVRILMKYLQSYSEILGIDIDKVALEHGRDAFREENIHFVLMDADQLGFECNSFDTVSISASLHHFSNISRVLNEVQRVLKPSGTLIIMEMHRNAQTEAELTSIALHHWVADVDTALGNAHFHTLARKEIIDIIDNLQLSSIEYVGDEKSDANPMEKTYTSLLEGLIETTIQRTSKASTFDRLKEQGKKLQERLHVVGAQKEPKIIIIGKK